MCDRPAARAELARESLPYATCLSEAEWAVVEPLLPAPAAIGRPRRWPMRSLFDGIQYVLRAGCAWRHLPLEFPPWGTVHRWFLRLSQAGVFERLAHALTMADRERAGRAASPSGAILDAQAARPARSRSAIVRAWARRSNTPACDRRKNQRCTVP
ncbi:transposase, partial [Methylobacterium trifolii]|uniref:transposase n=1 Tax=Methylobacterium trifolii TaxID=1003092 RepID=UPI0035A24981